MMKLNDYDKDVVKTIKFWQNERNCLILINENNREMTVLYLKTGEIDKDIRLDFDTDNKYSFIKSIRNYFKNK